MEQLIITPKTRIYDLLEAYPQLEDVLIASAPQFSKLKNPVLRKTIAKITNLGQAAAIGGLNVEELINKLRTEVGQDAITALDEKGDKYNMEPPGWFSEKSVVQTIDARDMLHTGDQPLHEVLAALKNLQNNEVLLLKAPFMPVPLIDKSISLGYQHWVDKKGTDFFVFFYP